MSSVNEERTEDLNPGSEDIEAKVKRMMDPTVPDAPDPVPKESVGDTPAKAPKTTPPPSAEATLPSAPELPGAKPAAAKKATQPETTPEVKQITLTEHNKSPTEVAEKLDEAIAGLGSQEPAANEKAAPEEEAPVTDPAVIADPATDKAVDDIVAGEGDELLEVEDAIRDSDDAVPPEKKPKKSIGRALKALLAKRAVRWGIAAGILLVALALMLIPGSRYVVLNTAGVHVSSSLLVLDESTGQPLKNVHVQLGDSSATTDNDGTASLKKVKLGPQTLVVEKRAFASLSKKITVGLGSNPLGDFKLTPTGSQYTFSIIDFLSRKPISKAEADGNGASAISDDKGNIKLTVDQIDDQKIEVAIKADTYRTEQVKIDPADKSNHALRLVPARKQVFVSKRSGKYDIYSAYIDGQDEKLVLAGSGSEREQDLVLAPHPSAEVVAYVSTRGNQHNSDGFLLSNLILINAADNSTSSIATSERLELVSWAGDYLVYVEIAAGSSANSPKRNRLISYNFRDGTSKELASANSFNDVTAAGGAIYYAPSSALQTTPANFYKVNPDGSGVQAIFGQEVWNIFRSAYDHLVLSVQQQWYDYHLGDKAPTKLGNAPVNPSSRVYIDSPDGKHSAWIDTRDGKGVLLAYDPTAKTDTTLRNQSGVTYPVSWLTNSVLVYRVKTDQETADYALSVDGGDPVKIKDVTNSHGIDRWYYY
jgi:hypothetical protein